VPKHNIVTKQTELGNASLVCEGEKCGGDFTIFPRWEEAGEREKRITRFYLRHSEPEHDVKLRMHQNGPNSPKYARLVCNCGSDVAVKHHEISWTKFLATSHRFYLQRHSSSEFMNKIQRFVFSDGPLGTSFTCQKCQAKIERGSDDTDEIWDERVTKHFVEHEHMEARLSTR
jgi:hypothetical protein